MPGRLAVLVSAVGGDLGQALVKSLRLMPEECMIIGTDIAPGGAGEAFVDAFHVVPPASEEAEYLSRMHDLCARYGVLAVVPGCEPEMRVLGRVYPAMETPAGVKIVAQPGQWFERYGDKLTCMGDLQHHVAVVPFLDGDDPQACIRFAAEHGYPLVVKPRRASGSASFSVVETDEELLQALQVCPDPLVQSFIEEGEGEFTVGVFAWDDFFSAVAFRRRLGYGGASWFAENSDQDSDVMEYCRKVAQASGLRGSCNVQVRKSPQGVRLLEINPRFSSLVAARAACGFKDLEWAVKLALGMEFKPQREYRTIRFIRYVHELVDFGDGFTGPAPWQPKGS